MKADKEKHRADVVPKLDLLLKTWAEVQKYTLTKATNTVDKLFHIKLLSFQHHENESIK